MSFGQEIKDFLNAYGAVNEVKDRRAARDLANARAEAIRAGPTDLEIAESQSLIDLRRAQAANAGDSALDATYKQALTDAAIARAEASRASAANAGDSALDIQYKQALTDAAKARAEASRAGIDTGDGIDFNAIAEDYARPPSPALPFTGTPTQTPAHAAVEAQATGQPIPTREAVRQGGLMSFQPEQPPTQGAIPTDTPQPAAPTKRLPKGTIENLWAVIDPDGTMPEAERNFRAFGTIYNHFLERGESDKAKKAAGDLYAYYKDTSMKYAAIARAAAESGDMEQAVKALEKTYANIPDGIVLKAGQREDGGYDFSFVDIESGELVKQGAASPKEIVSLIMGIQPTDFEEYIAGAAGLKRGDGPDTFTPAETATNAENVEVAVEDFAGRHQDTPQLVEMASSGELRDATNAILGSNSGMLPSQAVEFAANMTRVNRENINAPMFQFGEIKNGMVPVRDPKIGTVRVPVATVRALKARWEQNKQAEILAAAERAKRSERDTGTMKAITDNAAAALDLGKEVGKEVGEYLWNNLKQNSPWGDNPRGP